jgi:hypothetical protein
VLSLFSRFRSVAKLRSANVYLLARTSGLERASISCATNSVQQQTDGRTVQYRPELVEVAVHLGELGGYLIERVHDVLNDEEVLRIAPTWRGRGRH